MTSRHGRGAADLPPTDHPGSHARRPEPGSRGPGRQGPGGGNSFSYPKAILLAVVAVALGTYLLHLGPAHPSAAAPPPTTVPSTTSTTAPPATTTTLLAPSQSVKILVANASTTNGVATFYTHKLAGAGWGTLTPVNASAQEATSTVYYATGQQPAATSIAVGLGLSAGAVQPLSSSTPVVGVTGASVVVVAGADLAAKTTTATSTAG